MSAVARIYLDQSADVENPAATQEGIDDFGGHAVVIYRGYAPKKFAAVCHISPIIGSDRGLTEEEIAFHVAWLCWVGPTRSTAAQAIFDGRHHNLGPVWVHFSAVVPEA